MHAHFLKYKKVQSALTALSNYLISSWTHFSVCSEWLVSKAMASTLIASVDIFFKLLNKKDKVIFSHLKKSLKITQVGGQTLQLQRIST